MRIRAVTGVLVAVVAALVLAGCGGDNTAGSTLGAAQAPNSEQQADEHNQADIAFAQGMIPHHAQAIEMARLAQDRAQASQVRNLAGRIEQAQGPEIETMTAWLRNWNAQVPPTGQGGMGHAGMVPGMMDPQQMHQFDQVTGAEFDRLFLQMMIRHHEGAIAMSRAELTGGQNPAAEQLAQRIIDAQQAEIQEMRALLPPG